MNQLAEEVDPADQLIELPKTEPAVLEEESVDKDKEKEKPLDDPMEEDSVSPATVFCIRLKQPRSNLQYKMSVPELCRNFRYSSSDFLLISEFLVNVCVMSQKLDLYQKIELDIFCLAVLKLCFCININYVCISSAVAWCGKLNAIACASETCARIPRLVYFHFFALVYFEIHIE
jgi:hypothetical protein